MVNLNVEKNLLMGVLALELRFIAPEQLIASVGSWSPQESRPLDQVLVDDGALQKSRRALVEVLASDSLAEHDGDPIKSLAALNVFPTISEELSEIEDRDIKGVVDRVLPLCRDASRAEEAGSEDSEQSVRFRVSTTHPFQVRDLNYMSPEQANCAYEDVGRPSDVYNLGATLYHLLTNYPPVSARQLVTPQSIQEAVQKVLEGDFPCPRQINSQVPASHRHLQEARLAHQHEKAARQEVIVVWTGPL